MPTIRLFTRSTDPDDIWSKRLVDFSALPEVSDRILMEDDPEQPYRVGLVMPLAHQETDTTAVIAEVFAVQSRYTPPKHGTTWRLRSEEKST